MGAAALCGRHEMQGSQAAGGLSLAVVAAAVSGNCNRLVGYGNPSAVLAMWRCCSRLHGASNIFMTLRIMVITSCVLA